MGRHAQKKSMLAPALGLVVGSLALGVGIGMQIETESPTLLPHVSALRLSGSEGAEHLPSHSHRSPQNKKRPVRLATPVHLSIPSVQASAEVEPLGVDADGQLAVPSDPWRVGWWNQNGEQAKARPIVLVGHRDSLHGPAVFYGLGALVVGDSVIVTDERGQRHQYLVTQTQEVGKYEFPTSQVYGKTRHPQLRLLTCGGNYTGDEYEDNVIVYAKISDEMNPS